MPAHAFIIRPFGTQEGIDFDRVERELIAPVLDELGISGRTTGEIVRQGNIRSDMFELLLTADVAIADISLHNANVYYELGIRHAFRERTTLMIRSGSVKVPFDLQTDRYFKYDAADPGASRDGLIRALRDSMAAQAKDSPVFQLLPRLLEQDPTVFISVPEAFRDAAQRAVRDDQLRYEDRLALLHLLATEIEGLNWEREGLRVVGEAAFNLAAHDVSVRVWERVRRTRLADRQANRRLATSYAKLGDLTRSDEAIAKISGDPNASAQHRAEAFALKGSNEKTRWYNDWSAYPEDKRGVEALRSPRLVSAFDAYHEGFAAQQNHFYSGLNALALLTIRLELATAHDKEWKAKFRRDRDADNELDDLNETRTQLVGAVRQALLAAQLASKDARDAWLAVSEADVAFLTEDRPEYIQNLYRGALAGAEPQVAESVRRQLDLYRELGLFADKVQKVSDIIGRLPADHAEIGTQVLLFTGHRVDDEDRNVPRFPRTAAAERTAREMIHLAVERERQHSKDRLVGLAGAASGGDILFHEVCAELGIESEVYLACKSQDYVRESVSKAGEDWVRRSKEAIGKRKVHVLDDALELPSWLVSKQKFSAWERNNLWLLSAGLAYGAARVTLVALWNGGPGDAPGGTADMVKIVDEYGGRTIRLDAKLLLQKAPATELAPLKKRVFISYAEADRSIVTDRIVPAIQKAGAEPWLAERNMAVGASVSHALKDAIEGSDKFVLVMSPRSQSSEAVKDQLWMALRKDMTPLPLKIDDCDPEAFHIRLARLNALDLREAKSEERLVEALQH